MGRDRIVDGTDTIPRSDSTDVLPILRLRITAISIVNVKGKYLLDKDKDFTAYLQDLATTSTVEKQAKDYCWRKKGCCAHLDPSIDTDYGETEFGVSDWETGIYEDPVALCTAILKLKVDHTDDIVFHLLR